MDAFAAPNLGYVTQQHIWSNRILGPLTDRRIAFYQKRGIIGASPFARDAERIKRKVKRKKNLTKKFFAKFDL